jgi:L-threonylcarbamoyladenylate synthase
VLADLGSQLDPATDVILDGGPSPIGVESTIVDCTVDPPQLLRPGGIPPEDIERLLDVGLAPASGGARAPGMLATHYSPQATVVLAADRRDADGRVTGFEDEGLRVSTLDFGDDLVAYARHLYQSLRDADADGADRIVAILPPAQGLGHAIRDRLEKAAAG